MERRDLLFMAHIQPQVPPIRSGRDDKLEYSNVET